MLMFEVATLTAEIENQIIDAMKAQLKKPNRAVVNSEMSFVKDRLENAGHRDAAKFFWNWYTMDSTNRTVKNPEMIRLRKELDALSAGGMPDWGYEGT